MKINTLGLTCALLLSTPAMAAPHWGYEGAEGPDHWAKLSPDFVACAGQNQSPVNIEGTVEATLTLPQANYQPGGASMINNGHTLQVDYAAGSTLLIDKQPFTLKQFHFHAPSENQIRGQSYPLEAHLVHANDKGELAVLAVMFEEGEANPLLTDAWHYLPLATGQRIALKSALDAGQLLQPRLDVYRFNGSLTTPPCSEGVRWLVLKQPMTASAEQIAAFKALLHHPNNRPVQPIHARQILE